MADGWLIQLFAEARLSFFCLAFVLALGRLLYILLPARARPARESLKAAVGVLVLFFIYVLLVGAIVPPEKLHDDETARSILSGAGILLSVSAAIVGWIYTAYAGRSNLITQHTVDAIQRYEMDPILERYKLLIFSHYPPRTNLSPDDAARILTEYRDQNAYRALASKSFDKLGRPKSSAAFAVVQIMNYFEFIASEVRNGNLDEKIAKRYLGNIIQTFTLRKAKAFVSVAAKDRPDQEIYDNLQWLVKRWFDMDLLAR